APAAGGRLKCAGGGAGGAVDRSRLFRVTAVTHFFPRPGWLVWLVLLGYPGRLWSGDDPPRKPDPERIEVRLRFSVEVLDPLNPGEAFVECIVRNKSAKAVDVPTVYTGGHD